MPVIKEVKIITESVIEDLDEAGLALNSERSEVWATGFMRYDDGCFTLSYIEEREGARTETDIFVNADSTRVKRKGAIVCDFLFCEGKSAESLYEIPPYKFDTRIYTRRLINKLCENGGEVKIIYDMSIGGAQKKTRMKITVSTV